MTLFVLDLLSIKRLTKKRFNLTIFDLKLAVQFDGIALGDIWYLSVAAGSIVKEVIEFGDDVDKSRDGNSVGNIEFQ